MLKRPIAKIGTDKTLFNDCRNNVHQSEPATQAMHILKIERSNFSFIPNICSEEIIKNIVIQKWAFFILSTIVPEICKENPIAKNESADNNSTNIVKSFLNKFLISKTSNLNLRDPWPIVLELYSFERGFLISDRRSCNNRSWVIICNYGLCSI